MRCCAPRPYRPSSRALLALLAAAASARAYPNGYDNCDREWPSHGVNNAGLAGGFTASLVDAASGAPATSWTAGHSYRVLLSAPAGGAFRGVAVVPFIGAAADVVDRTGALHGVLAPGADGTLRAMLYCAGGVTQVTNTDKASGAAVWTPGALGTGTATLWFSISTLLAGNNWEVKLEVPELAPSPGVSIVPAPSASPSAPARTHCANAIYVTATARPNPDSPSIAPTGATPIYSADGWSGHATLGSGLNLAWVVLNATAEVAFTMWHVNSNTPISSTSGPVYVSVALTDSHKMTYPTSGLAVVGTANGGVSTVLMRGYAATDMFPGPPTGFRGTSATFTNKSAGTARVTLQKPPVNVTTYNATLGRNVTKLVTTSYSVTAKNFNYNMTAPGSGA